MKKILKIFVLVGIVTACPDKSSNPKLFPDSENINNTSITLDDVEATSTQSLDHSSSGGFELFEGGQIKSSYDLGLQGVWLLVDYEQEEYFYLSERYLRPLLGKRLEFTDSSIFFDNQVCTKKPLLTKTIPRFELADRMKIYHNMENLGINDPAEVIWPEWTIQSWLCEDFDFWFGILVDEKTLVTNWLHTFIVFEKLEPGQLPPTLMPRTPFPPIPEIYCTPDANYEFKESLINFFFEQVQPAILAGDKQKVVELVRYPIEVRVDEEIKTINTPEEFLGYYDVIVNQKVYDSVASEINPAYIFVNWEGLMTGQGDIWITSIYDDESQCTISIKINAINN